LKIVSRIVVLTVVALSCSYAFVAQTKQAIALPLSFIDSGLTVENDTDEIDTGGHIPTIESNYNRQLDLIDVTLILLKKRDDKRTDTGELKSTRPRISAIPAAGYTLQTGFAGLITANAAFYTNPQANTSTLLTSFTYTVRNQIIFPVLAYVWTKDNRYNIITDWRYLYFPSYTYGLGGYTSLNNGYLITYSTIRLHQTAMRKVAHDMYAGIG
jgi:hypothetical protein